MTQLAINNQMIVLMMLLSGFYKADGMMIPTGYNSNDGTSMAASLPVNISPEVGVDQSYGSSPFSSLHSIQGSSFESLNSLFTAGASPVGHWDRRGVDDQYWDVKKNWDEKKPFMKDVPEMDANPVNYAALSGGDASKIIKLQAIRSAVKEYRDKKYTEPARMYVRRNHLTALNRVIEEQGTENEELIKEVALQLRREFSDRQLSALIRRAADRHQALVVNALISAIPDLIGALEYSYAKAILHRETIETAWLSTAIDSRYNEELKLVESRAADKVGSILQLYGYHFNSEIPELVDDLFLRLCDSGISIAELQGPLIQLLTSGADVNVRDGEAAILAEKTKNRALLRFLLTFGLDPQTGAVKQLKRLAAEDSDYQNPNSLFRVLTSFGIYVRLN